MHLPETEFWRLTTSKNPKLKAAVARISADFTPTSCFQSEKKPHNFYTKFRALLYFDMIDFLSRGSTPGQKGKPRSILSRCITVSACQDVAPHDFGQMLELCFKCQSMIPKKEGMARRHVLFDSSNMCQSP